MPALNFSSQFVDAVIYGLRKQSDGYVVKRQTIRPRRRYPIEAGDTLYLYTAQRTKQCQKLGEATCVSVEEVRIDSAEMIVWRAGKQLSRDQAGVLASRDGFNSLQTFFAWFEEHYGADFQGVLIRW